MFKTTFQDFLKARGDWANDPEAAVAGLSRNKEIWSLDWASQYTTAVSLELKPYVDRLRLAYTK